MPVKHIYSNKKLPPPSQIARAQTLAGQKQQLDKKTTAIIERIEKCLARAQHPNTPEKEAITAWMLAGHLMTENNIKEADLLQRNGNESTFARSGGESVVAIKSTKSGGARVIFQDWVNDVARAVTILFDCKCYSQRRATSIDWIFYGIKANTVAAAMAFEMAHNLMQDWARHHVGRNAKHSYCLGLGTNLEKIAREEKNKEEQSIRKPDQPTTNTWASNVALVQFRQSAERVAIEYLKAQNIKLGNSKKRTTTVRNQAAYQAGVDDSKEIDLKWNLKRKRIENE